MTPRRLDDLRTALAALAQTPIATLEVHPLDPDLDTNGGIRLASNSPLAQQLAKLIANTEQSSSTSPINAGMEALFRMVVPGESASKMSGGLIRARPRKGPQTRRRGAADNPFSGVAQLANFVPANGSAGMQAAVAASLVLMTVAAGALAIDHIDRQFKGITELLERLHEDSLDKERIELDSSRPAIAKATAILLDRGRIGEAIAVGGAVTHIDKAIAAATLRLTRWQQSLARFGDGKAEFSAIRKAFKGIDSPAGEFYAHLQLALLAIDLKRRVLMLQAVEQAQIEDGNSFERFMEALHEDQQNLEGLSVGINDLLVRMSALEVDRTHGVLDVMFTPAEVDNLLRTAHHLRELSRFTDTQASQSQSDVSIEIARHADGSIVVFPAEET